jgi:hypothetical protein
MTETNRRFSEDVDSVYVMVKAACIKLGLTIVKEDAGTRRIQVSTGWSAFSWGETMNILVTYQKDGSLVTVDSNPKVGFNLTASGRAKRNVKLLFEELERKSQT